MAPALEEFLRSLTVGFQSLTAFVSTFPASLAPCGSSRYLRSRAEGSVWRVEQCKSTPERCVRDLHRTGVGVRLRRRCRAALKNSAGHPQARGQ